MGSPNDFYAAKSSKKPALLVKYKSGRDELLKFNNSKERDKAFANLAKINTVENIKKTHWET